MMYGRITQTVLLIFLVLFILTGCAAETARPSQETVGDIFSTPTEGTEALQTDETQTSEPQSSTVGLGNISHGFGGQPQKDENGRSYREYNGGEMILPYEIEATGRVAQDGIGILLFLDGQLQPYKCTEEDTYSYIHTFYPADGETYVTELIFTPVTGQEGDMLEIYGININCPSIYASDGSVSPLFGLSSVGAGTQLKFTATPEKVDYGLNFDRVLSQSVTYTDVSSDEIRGWSTTALEENCESHLYVNDRPDTGLLGISGITADEPVTLRFEVWGSPHPKFGLVFFVDNQPISADPEDIILFDMENGKKVVVEAQIDLSDFDGESYIYAVLVPRNYRSSSVLISSFVERSKTFYLYGDE